MKPFGGKKLICSHNPTIVYTVDDIDYYCCDQIGANDFDGDLIVNFTGIKGSQKNHLPEQLKQYVLNKPEEIVLKWQDFGTPKVKNGFWSALHMYALEKNAKTVCLHCMGGHGRTGTAMAAILISNANFTASKAISFVRKEYCELAVENKLQENYLYSLEKFVKHNKKDMF